MSQENPFEKLVMSGHKIEYDEKGSDTETKEKKSILENIKDVYEDGVLSVEYDLSHIAEGFKKIGEEQKIKKNIESATNLSEISSILLHNDNYGNYRINLEEFNNGETNIEKFKEWLNGALEQADTGLSKKIIKKTQELLKLEEVKEELGMKHLNKRKINKSKI